MEAQEYLVLRSVQLKSPEEWAPWDDGVAFVFARGGTGTCALGKATHALSPGDLAILSNTSRGKICAGKGTELGIWFFSVQPEHFFPLFDCGEMSKLHGAMESLKQGKLYPSSSTLARECQKLLGDVTSQRGVQHRAELLRISAAILSAEFNKVRPQSGGFIRIEEHLARVLESLSVAEILNSSVTELAVRFRCGKRHLNRLFHQHFGFPVATLKMEMRLLKAVSLLRDPSIKIINVAEQCGFNHLGLFNICFKRRFGVSPGQWRKTHEQVEIQPASLAPGETGCRMREIGLCPWSCKPVLGKMTKRKTLPTRNPRQMSAEPIFAGSDPSVLLVGAASVSVRDPCLDPS